MAKKTFNYISDLLDTLKQVQSEMNNVLNLQQQLNQQVGQQQAVGGGTQPQGTPAPHLRSVDGQQPLPPPPLRVDTPDLSQQQTYIPNYTQQQRIAADTGVPLFGHETIVQSDLAQARIAELTLGSTRGQQSITALSSQLQGGTGTDIETSKRLEELNSQWRELSGQVRKITDSMSKMDRASDDYAQAIAQLTEATKKETVTREQLRQAQQEAQEILRSGGGAAGAGGGGGEPPWYQSKGFGRAATIGGVLAGGIGLGGQAYQQFGNVYQAASGVDLESELRTYQALGQSEAFRARRMFGVNDLTRGENAVRYFGDYLTGESDRYTFLGAQGRETGRELSSELTQRTLDFHRKGLGFTMAGGTASIASRAVGILPSVLGGAAMGAGAGAMVGMPQYGAIGGAAIGGLTALMGGLGQASQMGSAYATNKYALSQGGLADTSIGNLMFGDRSSDMSERAFQQYWIQRQTTEDQYLESLRDAEMMSRQAQKDIVGYNQVQQAIRQRQAAASSVGGFATDSLPFLSRSDREVLANVTEEVETDIAERSNYVNTIRQQRDQNITNRAWRNFESSIESEFNVESPEYPAEMSLGQMRQLQWHATWSDKGPFTASMEQRLYGQFQSIRELEARGEIDRNEMNQRLRGVAARAQESGFDNLAVTMMKPIVGEQVGQETDRQHTRDFVTAPKHRLEQQREEVLAPYSQYSTMLGNLEMTHADFAQRQNLATSIMFGGAASSGLTTDLIRMSRGGLGSEQQLAQNVMQLQKVGGRQEDFEQLKDVLSEAVSIGFNKSSMAQQFVQATTNMAAHIRTTDVGRVASDLAVGSKVFGLGGDASLLSLQEAQQGMAAFESFTGQRGGLTGQLKTMAAFESGMTVAGGAGLAAGMNHSQLREAQQAIRTGRFRDPRTERLVRSMARDRGLNFNNLSDEDKEQLSSQLKNVQSSMLGGVKASFAQQGGNWNELISEAQQAVDNNDMDSLQNVLATVGSFGAQTHLGEQGSIAGFTNLLDTDSMSSDARRQLDRQIQAGNQRFSNPEQQAKYRFMNELTTQMATRMSSAAGSDMMKRYFQEGGETLTVMDYDADGRPTNLIDVAGMEDYKNLSDTAKRSITNRDLMHGIQSAMSVAEEGYGQGIDFISSRALHSIRDIIISSIKAIQQETPSSNTFSNIFSR